MRWDYRTYIKTHTVGRNDDTYTDPKGLVIESIDLSPQTFVAETYDHLGQNTTPQPDDDIVRDYLAKSIADKLMLDVLRTYDQMTNSTKFRASTVVYFKPNEQELFKSLNQEKQLNSKLNVELYDYRELVNTPWELFKLSFEVSYNKIKSKLLGTYYRYVLK